MHKAHGNRVGKIGIEMLNQIEVNGIKLYAHHGCLEEEKLIGGNYTVNVTLWTDFSSAAATDELDETIDYVIVNRIVAEEMAIRSKLIEHVGQRIVDRIEKRFSQLNRLRVKVIKHTPPINGDVDNVAIVIEKRC